MGRISSLLRTSGCPHRFSWPRRLGNGEHYQVCLDCGAEYAYDWQSLRRTRKLTAKSRAAAEAPLRRRHWHPRSRRIKCSIAAELRITGSTTSLHATVLNISESGLAFQTQTLLETGDVVSLTFDMPEELAGRNHSRVLCEVRVVRQQEPFTVSAAILACSQVPAVAL